jgi:hypothetical protein
MVLEAIVLAINTMLKFVTWDPLAKKTILILQPSSHHLAFRVSNGIGERITGAGRERLNNFLSSYV